jgi:hexosaminidase
MKNLLILVLLMAFVKVSGQGPDIQVIPQPVSVKSSAGPYKLTLTATIGYNNAGSKSIADMLVNKLNTATGYKLKTVQGNTGDIQLNLLPNNDQKLGSEGYTLETSPKGIVISANQQAGLFYGVQTLFQLLPYEIESNKVVKANWTVPGVTITDFPRFAWRGLMLDVSRNFFTKEEVKQYIDEMARFKYNTFHWHLTDDNGWRIEIKSLPRLTEVGAWRVPRIGTFGRRKAPMPGEKDTDGGFYTQDDIREVIKFAQERNVTIVPEIDVPGHSMAAIAAYPELSCTKDGNTRVNPGSNFSEWYGDGTFKMLIENTLNPSDEKVYEFLDKVFTEVAALFPNQYIHVGGDECYRGYWEKDAACQALMKQLNTDESVKLHGYFMQRVEKILNDKGKKLLGWDEILEGGISPGATVMSWRGIKGGIEAALLGHDVVMTPTTFAYLDYTQGDPTVDPPLYANLRMKDSYSFNPVPREVEAKYILGGQGNLWTEQIPTLRHAYYMTYPRGWALAEVFWSPDESKNWPDFVKRTENQFKRADIAGMNYSRSMYDPIVKTSMKGEKLWIEMESEVSGIEIFYSIDGTMPDNFSRKYLQPFEMPEGPITLRVIAWRNGTPIGHLITLTMDEMKERAGN